jgi:hypothetical protein
VDESLGIVAPQQLPIRRRIAKQERDTSMQKNSSGNCCLIAIIGSLIIALCLCLGLVVGFFALLSMPSSLDGSLAFLVPSPTPITTCRGEMDQMLAPFPAPPGKKIPFTDLLDLATYDVNGDTISDPNFPVVDTTLASLQENTVVHQKIWDYFVMLVPRDLRRPITQYKIITDGSGNDVAAQAYVEWSAPFGGSPSEKWVLRVDPADYYSDEQFTSILIHEYGHFLTLSVQQIDVEADQTACPGYHAATGCSANTSYLQSFYSQFWKGVQDDWTAIAAETDKVKRTKALDAYVDAHPHQFVTYYAFTKPDEDIAESWKYFVLGPKPVGATVIDKKILFFYDYPELVQIRSRIQERLCPYYHFPADS